MPTKLRGSALDACPLCGEVKKSYPQHWNRSADCGYPAITSDELQQVVRGILLSDGSLEGSKHEKLRVETTSKPLAEWLYDQLGDLAGGLRKHRKENPNSDVYRVSSLSHPDLNQYREWYDGSQKRIPVPDCLDEIGMTVFYALDGSLNWGQEGQRPRITFKAVDEGYRDDLGAMLRAYNPKLTITQANDHVALSAEDTDAFLDSLVGSVPGVEHKWATNRIEYETLRQSPLSQQEYETRLCIAALETVAERTSGKPTPEQFDEQIEVVDAATVRDTLGGGSWSDTLNVAGVRVRQEQEGARGRDPRFPRDSEKYDKKDVREALRAAAVDIGGQLTTRAYDEWAREKQDTPGRKTIAGQVGRYESWAEACEDAGVEPRQGKGHTRESMIEAVARVWQQLDHPPTLEQYDQYRHPADPSYSYVYQTDFDGLDSWDDLIDAAAEQNEGAEFGGKSGKVYCAGGEVGSVMTQNTTNTEDGQIRSELVFDVEKYRDYEPYERIAKGAHERGRRKTEYIYDLDTETDETMLRVHARYYLDGELKKETGRSVQEYPVEDGRVYHTDTGQDIEEFIKANFSADPEVSLGDEFESIVEDIQNVQGDTDE